MLVLDYNSLGEMTSTFRSDGLQTIQRVYWSNKATGIVQDVPSEAILTPQFWGHLDGNDRE